MKVTLLPDLFEPPIRHTSIIAMLGYAIDDRHRIELDVANALVAAWFTAQAAGLQEEISLALELSTQAEALEPSHGTAYVTARRATDLRTTPARLHIDDAHRFLTSPYVVVLEDAVSDRAFLESMLTHEERVFFQGRLNRGYVRIDHGGGIPVMTRRARTDSGVPESRHLLWFLFDSDAMQPGAPSPSSEALRYECEQIAHHQLRRRYVESYLPHQALHGWAATQPRRSARDERLQLLRSFLRMTDDQRHHYNMKHGFKGDAGRTDAAGGLYDGVPHDDVRTLADGFGGGIAELFADGSVSEADLRRDAGWAELRPVVRDLLGRIR